jgi:AhpD family alkylhydroperoxidase
MSPPMPHADERSESRGAALLGAIGARLGFTPTIASLLVDHPDVLALIAPIMCIDDQALSPMIQGSLGVAIAQEQASGYCLSMHAYLAAHAAKLSAEEIALNQEGQSDDARTEPLVSFAVRTVRANGHVTEADMELLRSAGLSGADTLLLLLTIFRDVASALIANILSPPLDFPAHPLATRSRI